MSLTRKNPILTAALSAALVSAAAICAEPVARAQQPASPPSASPTAAPASETTNYKQMGWGGIGVRVGYTMPRLNANKLTGIPVVGSKINDAKNTSDKAVDNYNAVARPPQPLPHHELSEMSITGRVIEVTPVFHLGGDGYFFKIELPLNLSPEFSSYGLGLYPINYGYYIDSIGLFPYLSLGGSISYATATRYTSAGGDQISMKAKGAVMQARAALGVKFYVTSYLPMSVEFGYSPYAAGGVIDSKAVDLLKSTSNPSTGTSVTNIPNPLGSYAKGGIGTMWNLTFGAEWL